MESAVVTNFHYEYQLANQNLSLKKVRAINQEFEYIALLWGGVEKIYAYQEYTTDYLDKVERLTGELAKIEQGPVDGVDYFWGVVDPKYAELNSKKTSYEVGAKLGVNPPAQYYTDHKKILNAIELKKESFVIRSDFSVSGRGILVAKHPKLRIPDEVSQFLQKTIGQGYLLEDYYERVIDFSAILNEEECFIYETLVDSKGIFRGVNSNTDEILKYIDGNYLKEIYQKIYNAYKAKGASTIQVDSFLYKKDGEIHLYPLVEVNARKTMGEFAKRLLSQLKLDSKKSVLYFLGNRSSFRPKVSAPLELSPKTSKHNLILACYDDYTTQRKDINYFLNGPQ